MYISALLEGAQAAEVSISAASASQGIPMRYGCSAPYSPPPPQLVDGLDFAQMCEAAGTDIKAALEALLRCFNLIPYSEWLCLSGRRLGICSLAYANAHNLLSAPHCPPACMTPLLQFP